MSTFSLKMIAIITMLIDHIGVVFIPGNTMLYMIFRSIGRLAFPIFVFLLIEGFYHTRNVNKYLTRLGIFALISEIPFDLAFYHASYRNADLIHELKSGAYSTILSRMMNHQNVFFTLFLGLLLVTLMSRIEKKFSGQIIFLNLVYAILTVIFCIFALLLKTDYHLAGILLIVAFYIFRGNKLMLIISLLIITGMILGGISILATLSVLIISLYNGKKGKDIKYFFYIFYPAHLLILFLLDLII